MIFLGWNCCFEFFLSILMLYCGNKNAPGLQKPAPVVHKGSISGDWSGVEKFWKR